MYSDTSVTFIVSFPSTDLGVTPVQSVGKLSRNTPHPSYHPAHRAQHTTVSFSHCGSLSVMAFQIASYAAVRLCLSAGNLSIYRSHTEHVHQRVVYYHPVRLLEDLSQIDHGNCH